MHILIVVATAPEIAPLQDRMKYVAGEEGNQTFMLNDAYVTIVITGVGMVATAAATGYYLGKKGYDLVINAGICGAFNPDLKIGEVVNVTREYVPELGVRDQDQFIHAFDMGLADKNARPYDNGWLFLHKRTQAFSDLRVCSGVTVNTVTGNADSIQAIKLMCNPDVETMEGAGFISGAGMSTWAAVQIRSVSNYVEVRDKSKWNIPLAIANLNDVLFTELSRITS
jgi:futalosine hydrolase